MPSLNGAKLYIGSDIPIAFTVTSPDGSAIDSADLFFYLRSNPESSVLLDLSNTTGGLSKTVVSTKKVTFTGSIPRSFTSTFTKSQKIFFHSKVVIGGKHRIDRSYIGMFTLELP